MINAALQKLTFIVTLITPRNTVWIPVTSHQTFKRNGCLHRNYVALKCSPNTSCLCDDVVMIFYCKCEHDLRNIQSRK